MSPTTRWPGHRRTDSIVPRVRSGLRRLISLLTPPRAALILGCVAIGSTVIWLFTNAADAWMPNVATTAVEIAVTITAVQWLLDRQVARRLLPLRLRALRDITEHLGSFIACVEIDYRETHPADDLQFDDAREILDTWAHGVDEDAKRIGCCGGDPPGVTRAATALGRALNEVGAFYGAEVLGIDVSGQLRSFSMFAESAERAFAVEDRRLAWRVTRLLVHDALRLSDLIGTIMANEFEHDHWFATYGNSTRLTVGPIRDAWERSAPVHGRRGYGR